MSIRQPTPDDARAAIVYAAAAGESVRSADRLFRSRLLALAGATIGSPIVIVVLTALPNWMGPIKGMVMAFAIAGAVFAVVWTQTRQRAYSPVGRRWFVAILLVWIAWGMAVFQWSFHSGWLDYQLSDLEPDWRFVFSGVVATIPLLTGALLIGRRR